MTTNTWPLKRKYRIGGMAKKNSSGSRTSAKKHRGLRAFCQSRADHGRKLRLP